MCVLNYSNCFAFVFKFRAQSSSDPARARLPALMTSARRRRFLHNRRKRHWKERWTPAAGDRWKQPAMHSHYQRWTLRRTRRWKQRWKHRWTYGPKMFPAICPTFRPKFAAHSNTLSQKLSRILSKVLSRRIVQSSLSKHRSSVRWDKAVSSHVQSSQILEKTQRFDPPFSCSPRSTRGISTPTSPSVPCIWD